MLVCLTPLCCCQMLQARQLIVRNKLMVPQTAAGGTNWSLTSIVHLPRYAPRVALGAEAVFKVGGRWQAGGSGGGRAAQ